MNASTETIYQAIYIQAKGQLRRDISQQLRSGRTACRPRTAPDARKPRFREPMVMISERPPEAEDRAVPGHWEGDLITGAANKSAIGTLVERSSRNVILLHLPDGHGSGKVQEAIARKMARLPRLMRNSLTWDHGSEMALHGKISVALDMGVYFCDPHSPWQRGANENANGLLRQRFPKGADLSIFPEEHLDAVAEELNDRPRKTFGWRKPSEVFLGLINDSLTAWNQVLLTGGVATFPRIRPLSSASLPPPWENRGRSRFPTIRLLPFRALPRSGHRSCRCANRPSRGPSS